MSNNNTALALFGDNLPLELKAKKDLREQQAALLVAAGRERARAMFAQGSINDIAALSILAENLKLYAPGGSRYYDRIIDAHAMGCVRQMEEDL